ncbi:hypothetical protein GCK32_001166, partial [Trichostrongylus colubriformis]
NAPQKYQEVKKPVYSTRPRIQVNPAAYKQVQPYAPRPYVPRPLPAQNVAQYKESFIPRLQPLPPPAPSPVSVPLFPPSPPAPYFPPVPPFQTYPQSQAPVFHPAPAPSYPAPQSQQGCCGGQLVSSQGTLCVPANFDPCSGSQSQPYQRTDGGCGVCSPTCTSACQLVTNQGCGSGDCCTLRWCNRVANRNNKYVAMLRFNPAVHHHFRVVAATQAKYPASAGEANGIIFKGK